ncbi:MAG: hypothetical protein IKR26_03350 [Lachnospiraceae bacterium]|nr:hypothetical protein [Lachnospiraceae bacterium]
MAEYLANAVQSVALNAPIIFTASIPCAKGYIYHEDETGIFTLRGIVNNPCANDAQYKVTFNGNVAIPTGGAITPVAVALSVSGEPRLTSRAIYTPAAVDEYGNLTSTATIKVPRGCCFNLSVEYVSGTDDPTVTPTPIINVQNANLTITRTA